MFVAQPTAPAPTPVLVYVALTAPSAPPVPYGYPFSAHPQQAYPYPLAPNPHGYCLPYPAPAYSPVLAPAPPAPKKEKEQKESAPKEARPAASTLPAPLLELLRNEGPYLANEVFSCVPTQPLEAIPEDTPAPEWYAITKGRFVGVVDQYALCDFASTGVAHAARKAYDNQQQALTAFNKALTWGWRPNRLKCSRSAAS
ncbi:hypothetical protein R3P38DRAFT_2773876 [Favolaschia claudopus]|uniref:Uncharacterized protein n=1 Tax=Favolaschia claudopus TaxID=2862362 RepID=A0AAW0BWJ5_9AGAR